MMILTKAEWGTQRLALEAWDRLYTAQPNQDFYGAIA